MTTIELLLAGMTVLGGGVCLRRFLRAKDWRRRVILVVITIVLGLSGFATVVGYHQLFAMNYRFNGEFKRENTTSDWMRFLIPLGVWAVSLGAATASYFSIVPARRRPVDVAEKE